MNGQDFQQTAGWSDSANQLNCLLYTRITNNHLIEFLHLTEKNL